MDHLWGRGAHRVQSPAFLLRAPKAQRFLSSCPKLLSSLPDPGPLSLLITGNIPSGMENSAGGSGHSLGPRDFPAAIVPQETLLLTRGSSGAVLGEALSPCPPRCPQSMWKTQRSTVKGYFLAGGQMVWWPVSTPVPLPCPSAGAQPTSPNRNKPAKVTPVFCQSRIGFFPQI